MPNNQKYLKHLGVHKKGTYDAVFYTKYLGPRNTSAHNFQRHGIGFSSEDLDIVVMNSLAQSPSVAHHHHSVGQRHLKHQESFLLAQGAAVLRLFAQSHTWHR